MSDNLAQSIDDLEQTALKSLEAYQARILEREAQLAASQAEVATLRQALGNIHQHALSRAVRYEEFAGPGNPLLSAACGAMRDLANEAQAALVARAAVPAPARTSEAE